ncbi:MAG: PA0069 family radical SAM protein [Bacteroidetes bacterium]|nr:MAG: PA0069 family radical SAM protein [Bacteroidota bacterium]
MTTNTIKGRGSSYNTPNRFEKLHLEPLEIEWEDNDEKKLPTQFFKDTTKTILAKNDSPDIPFTYGINPYRGCEHGCIYCYARPSHEYLGFSAGLDFETKIMVKEDAPVLLEKEFQKKSWQPQMISLSSNVDCYQPIERKLQITRRLLQVFLKYRNPVGVITKNHLITRDVDILQELASLNLVHTIISITSLNDELIRSMEPRTSPPAKRLEAIQLLAEHNIPVGVNVAPIIPGLNDEEIPAILKEASVRGATSAGWILVRLPWAVKPLFLDWLQRTMPDRAAKIINRIKDTRDGELSDPNFGSRMRGEGEIAHTIRQLFKVNCEKYGFNKKTFYVSTEHFVREQHGQLNMFG